MKSFRGVGVRPRIDVGLDKYLVILDIGEENRQSDLLSGMGLVGLGSGLGCGMATKRGLGSGLALT